VEGSLELKRAIEVVYHSIVALVVCSIAGTLFAADLRIVPGGFGSGKAYVRCYFDGVPKSCFVDTGSAMTLLDLSPPFASRPPSGTFRYKSASGRVRRADVIQIGTVRLDGKVLQGVNLGRHSDRAGETTLGMDLLGRSAFAMEFRTAPKIHIAPSVPRGAPRPLSVLKGGLLAIPVFFSGEETQAVWDTGASVTAVDKTFLQAHPENFRRLRTRVEGTDGTGEAVDLELFRAREIRVGSRVFKNLHVVAVDLSPLKDTVGSSVRAVLGFNVIRKANWSFDPAGQNWWMR
jgi:hypothetical protein